MKKSLVFVVFFIVSGLIGSFIYLNGPVSKKDDVRNKEPDGVISLHLPPNVEESIALSETPMFFNSATKQYQPVLNDVVIYYSDYSIGLKQYNVSGKESRILIPNKFDSEGNNIPFASDVSPHGNYLVYSDQFWDGTPSELILLNVSANKKERIADISGEKVYLSLSYWNPEEKYFYYSLGSSKANLHFPSPETIEFYRYNLSTSENTFVGRASMFTDKFHVSIFAESKDSSSFYVKTVQHGEGNVMSLWRVNSSSFEQTKIWDAGKDYYYQVPETNTKDILVLQTYEEQNDHFLILDLANGVVKSVKDYTLVSGDAAKPVTISKNALNQLESKFSRLNAVNLPDSIALELESEFINILNLETNAVSRHALIKPEHARLVWSVEK